MTSKYPRVLLKLSGEILAGSNKFGFDYDAIREICREIVDVRARGVEIGIVIGGGNIMRGKQAESVGRVQADYMGMLATVMNALALQDVLEALGTPTRVQTAIAMQTLAEPFIRRRALRHLEKGRIVIFAAGTGSPYFSTDTTAALRAFEINADCLLKATKVNGIYDKDPMKCPDAKYFPEISYEFAIENELEIMDMAAFSLCKENKMPIIVFNVLEKGNLERLLIDGAQIGSVVS